MSTPVENHWHLDKKVPITLVFTILVQTVAFVWFLAGVRKDVDQIKESNKVAEAVQRERDERQDVALREAVTRIEGGVKDVAGKIDRLIERAQK